MPLGVEREQLYHAAPLRLAPGDTLLLSTDGITEARASKTQRRQGDEFLGLEGLERLAREALSQPSLEAMADRVVEGARSFGGGSFRDDVCLLLARRL